MGDTVTTYWEPTVEERAALAYGANVELEMLFSEITPYIRMGVVHQGEQGPIEIDPKLLEIQKLTQKIDTLKEQLETVESGYDRAVEILGAIKVITSCPDHTNLEEHIQRLMEQELEFDDEDDDDSEDEYGEDVDDESIYDEDDCPVCGRLDCDCTETE